MATQGKATRISGDCSVATKVWIPDHWRRLLCSSLPSELMKRVMPIRNSTFPDAVKASSNLFTSIAVFSTIRKALVMEGL